MNFFPQTRPNVVGLDWIKSEPIIEVCVSQVWNSQLSRVEHSTVQYNTVLFSSGFYCNVLYSTLFCLYCTILCSTVLHFTVLSKLVKETSMTGSDLVLSGHVMDMYCTFGQNQGRSRPDQKTKSKPGQTDKISTTCQRPWTSGVGRCSVGEDAV